MPQQIETSWIILGVVALLAMVVVWWMLSRRGGARVREYKPDVLDEGQAPASRNQALIDAPPAARIVMPPAASDALGGMGEAVAHGAQEELAQPEAPLHSRGWDAASGLGERVAIDPQADDAEAVSLVSPPDDIDRVEAEVARLEAPPLPPEPAPQPVPPPEEIPAPQPEPAPEEIPPPEPEPQPEPAPPPSAPADVAVDDLSRIKGLGPKLQALLPSLGLSSFAQIAALSDADLDALDPQLGPFAGRPRRDSWVEQARYLAEGDVAGFEARFGKV